MGKRSRSTATATTRHPVDSSNAPADDQSGRPAKKRTVEAVDEAAASHPPRAARSAAVDADTRSARGPVPVNAHDARTAEARAVRASLKRSHADAFTAPSTSSSSSSTASYRSGVRRLRSDDGQTLLSPSSSTATTAAAPATNRTLVFDTAATPSPHSHGGHHRGVDATATPAASSSASPPPPLRRGVVLLTSTPVFLRQRGERDEGRSAEASAVSSPMRLMRAAQELLLSPARSTLMRGFSHLRQSVVGTAEAPPPSPGNSPAFSVSPLGRLSSIKPAREHLPSLPASYADDMDRHTGGAGRRHRHAEAIPSRPTALGLGASSASGSRRSSLSSAREGWGDGGVAHHEGRGGQRAVAGRPTIERDESEDDDGNGDGGGKAWRQQRSSASVRTASSLTTSRLSSPSVRDADVALADHHAARQHGRWHRGGAEYAGTAPTPTAAATALAGPLDARHATVSSLSESLANVVSSSRSTAQSSLTSGAHGEQQEVSPAARRRSATLMDLNLSSILPDEEERAVRRRMQRLKSTMDQQEAPRADRAGRQLPTNVLELPYVRTAQRLQRPPPPPREAQGDSGGGCEEGGALPSASASAPVGGDMPRRSHGAAPQHRGPRLFRSAVATTPTWHRIAAASRGLMGLCAAVSCLVCVLVTVSPLLALEALPSMQAYPYAASETAFVHTHVNPISDLQALYQVAPASLTADGVAGLHRRALGEAVERLERATQHLIPPDSAPPPRRIFYLRAMIRAYLAVQRNSELYARSRDESVWRRLLHYPLADGATYGIHRFGRLTPDASLAVSAKAEWLDRLGTTVACLSQSELLSCPSVLYVEAAMARAASPYVYTDANEQLEAPQRRRRLQDWRTQLRRDWDSEVYLETLLSYLRSSVQEVARESHR